MSELALKLIAENKKTKAKSLDLGNCGLTEVPEEVGELVWLEELSLSSEWWEFNLDVKKWKRKHTINRGAINNIVYIPDKISGLKQLKKLILNKNPIQSIDSIKYLSNLQILSCASTHIRRLSPIEGLKNLKQFLCYNTQISELEPLATISELELIYLDNTLIQDLSPLTSSTKLTQIFIYNTHVNSLKPLKRLSNLKLLFFDNTQISDLSPLEELTQLEEISFNNTKVFDLSPLAALTKLKKLYFDNTQVEYLHPIQGLKSLIELSCCKTKITDLAPIMTLIRAGIPINLKTSDGDNGIFVEDCSLTNPPIEIVKQGNAAILKFFSAKKKQGTDVLSEAKIVLVGAGESGKTTLVQKLLNPEHPVPNPNDKCTEGILITQYPMQNDLTAHLWDFGGQELYHATHQFFLTPDTLYLLLNDNRKNDTDFYYWLNILALRAGDDCPILTIFNAKGGAPRQIVPDETLFQHFPGLLREAVDVDFADKDLRRFNQLKDRIEQHFAALPSLGKPFPAFWVRVRLALGRRKEDHISWAQFRDICRAEKIEDEAEMHTLAQTLHNLGVLLWFSDVFGLDDLLVLQAQWCIDAVYKALNVNKLRDSLGKFSEADLHQIWRDERYRSQCNRLLKLMQHFDLCYPVQGSPGAFIAPQLLDLRPNPDPNFLAAGGITHRFQYEFMPAGLLTRFIARMSRHIHAPHVWRTGVVLRWANGTLAEVTENHFGKEITMRVSGQERKRRLSEMRQTLESIHSGFRGLKYAEKVACNCPDCVNDAQPSLFILGELEQDAKHGGDATCRNKNWKKIPAQSILDGIEYHDTPRIFVSYAPGDRRYVDEFTTMLAPLRKNGDWKVWHEAYLLPGDRFNKVVLQQFSEANVIVLLLTAKFFDSDDKWDIEMTRAIERHQQDNALVIGVVVSPCFWEETPFRLVQMLPQDGVTVDSARNRDVVWKEVVVKIKEAIGSDRKGSKLGFYKY